MKRQAAAKLPTKWGNFEILLYANGDDEKNPNIILVHEEIDKSAPVTVRIHSECLTGDLLGSSRCDCGEQLDESLKIIAKEKGVLIYLRQEGRGIGLINKIKAYTLQDAGLNTIEANIHLGFEADERHYDIAIKILNDLNVKTINLITNNPDKIEAIANSEIDLIDRIPIIIDPKEENLAYLKTKKDQMGHLLNES